MQRVIFFNLIILFIFQQYIDNQQCDMEMLAPRENSRSLYCEFAILKNNSTLCLPPSVPPIYNWAYPKLSHRSERISSDVTFNHSVFLWNLWVAKILFICQLYYLRGPTSCTAIIASLQRQKQKQVEAAVKLLPRCWCQYPLPFFLECPLLMLPSPTSFLTCTVDDRCLGLTCCASLDLVFTRLSTTAWAILDPCEFKLSVGLGSWSTNVTLFEYDWGVDKMLDISDSVHIA